MGSYDAEQVRLLGEQCIEVTPSDASIGPVSKEKSHKTAEINRGLLHRAFSVFLFNSKGELLLQQRAKTKITFPAYWTNTCCSHPLYTDAERDEKDHLGVKRAAQRKLEHELGIPRDTIKTDEFHFLSRLHYKAIQDETWGEHEIDHILFAQKDVQLKPNESEVMDTKYVNPKQLRELFAQRNDQLKRELKTNEEKLFITPWFEIICNEFLFKWWDELGDIIKRGGLEKPDESIHKISLPESPRSS